MWRSAFLASSHTSGLNSVLDASNTTHCPHQRSHDRHATTHLPIYHDTTWQRITADYLGQANRDDSTGSLGVYSYSSNTTVLPHWRIRYCRDSVLKTALRPIAVSSLSMPAVSV